MVANADPDRLQQVLLNLIENSCKYPEPPAPEELALQQSSRERTIEARDQGIGVPQEDQEEFMSAFTATVMLPQERVLALVCRWCDCW